MANSIITSTGSYIPKIAVPNDHFQNHEFYSEDGKKLDKPTAEIIQKFKEITCIEERRYLSHDLNTSDMAFMAAERALEGVDRETLDYIIVAHNFGEVSVENYKTEMLPAIASRVKHSLRIKNPYTVAYDIPFGCPGWLHGVIISDYYIKSGDAKKCLVIGAESLSRVIDPHDMDSMIYADGAGATLLEATDQKNTGILSHVTRSDTYHEAFLLRMGKSYNPRHSENDIFLKMDGHQIYKYAVKNVPDVVKLSLDKIGLSLTDVKKIFIHQANQKMDEAILARIFKLYKQKQVPESVMPMTIAKFGNSSVATIPTMLDLVQRKQLGDHRLNAGDVIVFASVGAGMNINSVVYRVP
jgi:3-oxoacyl-[acyl-carrier-protein] synthase-3